MDYYDILKRNNGNFSEVGCIISLMVMPDADNVVVKIQNTDFDTCHNCSDLVPSGYSALIYCVNNTGERRRQYCLESGVWDGGGENDVLLCNENHYLIAYFGAIISSVCILTILLVYSINQLLVHRQLARRTETTNAE